MAYTNNTTTSSVPQGFSVYQPQLGAALEFLPALGTKELDDMVNAYIPGPGAMQQKRAQVSMEFLTHFQQTGQAFKYFVVSDAAMSSVESPSLMPSPAQGSSSFTVSPVASDWDWSSVSGGNTATSSRSASSRKSTNVVTGRHQTAADFSHMPGMKIMTKEGLDVTNSASRGSKTKEQRDHAHLMRIIKACESCRKKKIRCDPSHKKRAVAASSQSAAKVSKKAKVAVPAVPQQQLAAPPALSGADAGPPPAPSLDLDLFPVLDPVDDLAMPIDASASWEDFIHYPQDMEPEYDFFFDPEGFLTPSISNASPTSSEDAASKSISPTSLTTNTLSDLEGSQMSSVDVFATGEIHNVDNPQLPYMGLGGSNDYTDFTLYSPASSFSEDERMLSVGSSTPSTSADGGSQLPSPPDRLHAPHCEGSNIEVSSAVLIDGQLRWAHSDDAWSQGSESVDLLARHAEPCHNAQATHEAVNTDHLLDADILGLPGQGLPALGDLSENANAIDRRHVLNQSAMTAASIATASSSTSALPTIAPSVLLSESTSNVVQVGNAQGLNNVLRTQRLRSSDALTSSTSVGSNPILQTATSSSPLASIAQVTTSHTSESSLAAIPLSSRSVSTDATDVLLRGLPATRNILGQAHALLRSSPTTTTAHGDVHVIADRDLLQSVSGAQALNAGVVESHQTGVAALSSSLSTRPLAIGSSSIHRVTQGANEGQLAVVEKNLERGGDATSALSGTLIVGIHKLKATLAPPSYALTILGVCMTMVLLATGLDVHSSLSVMAGVALIVSSSLRLMSVVRQDDSFPAFGNIQGATSKLSRGGGNISRQASSLFSTRLRNTQAITSW